MNKEFQEASSLFGFLKDMLRLRNRPVKLINTYKSAKGHLVHHLDETPSTKNGVAFWSSVGFKALGTLNGDLDSAFSLAATSYKEMQGSVLRLPKIVTPDAPQPSDELGAWLDADVDFLFETPRLMDQIEVEDDEGQVHISNLANNPEIKQAFERWNSDWQMWSERSKNDLAVKSLYSSLFEARDQIRNQSQDWEFILGVGRLRLGLGTEKEIDRHIFTVPCVIDLDENTGTLFVRIDDSSPFSIEDDWIQGFRKPELEDLEIVRTILNESEDLSDSLIKSEHIKLAHKFRADLITDADPGTASRRDSLVMAPSLILRKRGKQDLIKLLETFETELMNVDALPAPMRSWLEPGYGEKSSADDWSGDGAVISLDESTYLPLALNEKQIKGLELADSRNATIIQGPPGTGKTRTIAVMVSHFLAKGQRVLVAAQTPQALREVRSQLPEEIRDLAVASLGGGKVDNDDLQKAVNSLVFAHENRSELEDGFADFEKKTILEIKSLHKKRSELIRQIIDLRLQEAKQMQVDGISGTPSHLALVHLEQREKYAWVKNVSNLDSRTPNFTANDAESLALGLSKVWKHELQIDVNASLPALDDLWSEGDYKRGIELRNRSARRLSDFEIPAHNADKLMQLIRPAVDAQTRLRNSNSHWCETAIANALSQSENLYFVRLADSLKIASLSGDAVTRMGELTEIECGITSQDWLPILQSVKRRIAEKGDLQTSVTGEIKKPLVANSLMKNALPILNLAKIKGRAPATTSDIERIEAIVEFDHLVRSYASSMDLDDKVIPSSRYDQVLWLRTERDLLGIAQDFDINVLEIRKEINDLLPDFNKLNQDELNLDKLYEACDAVIAFNGLKEYERILTGHVAKVTSSNSGFDYQFVNDYVAALEANDELNFINARSILSEYIKLWEMARNVIEEIERLSENDNKFIETVTNWINHKPTQVEQREILEMIQDLVSGFSWRRLGEAINGLSKGDYAQLFKAVSRVDEDIEREVRELARRRSWKKALGRIDASTLVNMNSYALESKKLGAGKGVTAARRKRDIRKYLTSCIPAIPAWIMPIDRVAQFFPPQLEMFDVVIIDEASQARLDAIFLLALAKRVVIVGDNKQVSPDSGMLQVSEIEQLADRHLSNSPRRANWSNPDLSLFDECKIHFGNTLTLTEHRRCVPEIIGFSNQIAYIPDGIRLIPVRQRGSQALQPIRTMFVSNGYIKSPATSSGNEVNEPEAEVIVQEISRMISDPLYAGQTIGVVTLQGSKQQDVIRNRLLDVISPSEIESRQIRVGMPPDFQGSERNIIFLSMVVAMNKRFTSITKELMVQRYNVAASRAKDQLILVHSVRSEDLKNPADLRKQLIDYCTNVEATFMNPAEGTVGLVPENELISPFDSLFEQRVHNRIVERGYKVIPQYAPEIDGHDYRIDLVVVGPHGKYAVECDGDFWHGGPEQFAKDLYRQEVLQRCGWKFSRITESSFYTDPNSLDDLWDQLDKFVKQASGEQLVHTPVEVETEYEDFEEIYEEHLETSFIDQKSESTLFDFEANENVREELEFSIPGDMVPKEAYFNGLRIREFPKPLATKFAWIQPYRSWDPEVPQVTGKAIVNDEKLLDELLEIVTVEGPILGSHLMRIHYKSRGGSSLSSSSEAMYQNELKRLINREYLIAEEQTSEESLSTATFRIPSQPSVITRVRGNRDLYSMPPLEIAMIMRGVIETDRQLGDIQNREPLFRQVLILLDFTKLTTKAEEYLNRITSNYAPEVYGL
jgi:hypothetical protein